MSAKVELLHGRKVLNRILSTRDNAYKFTALPLWGPFEGVTLFLAHESNYRNADLRYRFRRICLPVLHPQKFFYEPKHSAISLLQDKIHIAASKMTDMPVREFYFRRKEWTKLVLNPFRAMAIKELGSVLNALHHSESEADVEQMTNNERKAERVDHRMDEMSQKPVHSTRSATLETCLQVEPTDSDLPVEVECSCIFCNNSIQPGPRQIFVDSDPRWTLHINRPLYVERLRFCRTCNQKRRFVPIQEEIHSVESKHLLDFAQTFQQFDSNIKAMLLDRLPPSSKRPRSARGNPLDSAVSYEAQSSTTQRNSNKRTRVPRKNPRQARNNTAHTRAILHVQTQISMASPAVALSSTPNPTIVPEEAGHELLPIEEDMILSNLTTNDRTARSDKVATSVSSGDSYLSASKESDKRCKRKRGADGDLIQSRAKENPAENIPRMESNLKTQKETTKANAIDSETQTQRLRTTHFEPHNKQESMISLVSPKEANIDECMVRGEFVHQPSRSTPQVEQQHFFRDLNLVKIDDMDCATRHDRLRTLKTIIKRGDEITKIEKAQLAELEAKGTRVHGRDLSRMNVADMDTVTRKTRRAVLRKKIDRYEVLNEAEMKQLKDFGMLLYTKEGT
jgi:hypothetical protein